MDNENLTNYIITTTNNSDITWTLEGYDAALTTTNGSYSYTTNRLFYNHEKEEIYIEMLNMICPALKLGDDYYNRANLMFKAVQSLECAEINILLLLMEAEIQLSKLTHE